MTAYWADALGKRVETGCTDDCCPDCIRRQGWDLHPRRFEPCRIGII